MLECILFAGALYAHVVHDPEQGVTLRATHEWEYTFPLEDSIISVTNRNMPDEFTLWFYNDRGTRTRSAQLSQDQFGDFTIPGFLESCPRTAN